MRPGATPVTPVDSQLAIVCEQLAGPAGLRLRSCPRREPAAGEIRVRIGAAGVNFPDLLMTRGTYQFRPDLPFIPGIEAAGLVVEAGPGVATLVPGDRVTLSARTGLFASEAVVPAAAASAAPPEFTMAEAACFRVAARTARHALVDRARLQPGETLLVLGAGGGLGLAAVEIGALLGARVIAAASSPAKLAVASARGASHQVDYLAGPLVEQVRGIAPEGVDVIFDPVGGDLFEQAVRLPAWNGRLLVVGFASGRIGRAPANRALMAGYSVIGIRAGEAARRDPGLAERCQRELLDWAAQGHLRPHLSAVLPLAEAGRALTMLEERRAIGRIALIVDEQMD